MNLHALSSNKIILIHVHTSRMFHYCIRNKNKTSIQVFQSFICAPYKSPTHPSFETELLTWWIESMHYAMRGGSRLHRALHTVMMPSTCGTKVMGKTPFMISNHFIRHIAHSTWMHTFAMSFVLLTSEAGIRSTTLLEGGISSVAIANITSSLIEKPRSARMMSPLSIRSKNVDCRTMWRSVVLSP